MLYRGMLAVFVLVVLVVGACSDGSDRRSAVIPEVPEAPQPASVRSIVETLASDEYEGRDNQSPGSALAREFLYKELSQFADPVDPDAEGIDGYLQPYANGTNVLAIVPGGDLADEYVMIGAHYDHHGRDPVSCAGMTEEDDICNGATDNATGVAATIDIVRAIVAEGTPRRSIIITLWDGEEDGLVGAQYYVENPIVPLEKTITYINFDIQGVNLLPSLRNFTILVGAETGGPNLIDAANSAREVSNLETVMLSLLFGQGRSDHAVLARVGVPVVFLTDANNGCYHTVKDDFAGVDFPKLDQQMITANALTRDLIATDNTPVFDATAPLSTFRDAAELLPIVVASQADFARFTPEQQVASEQFLIDLQDIVDAGEAAFDNAAVGTLLGGAGALVSTLRAQDCDPYLEDS
ncbi:MAG: M28 family metallopeptidase [Halioglobus sp.]